jgi:ribosomal protein L32
MNKSYIKCPNCGTENVNNDYCRTCGTIINVVLQRKLERDEANQTKLTARENEKPSQLGAFLKKGENHSNIIVRAFFKVMYAIWFFFAVIIGGFIAAVISAAAG